MTFEGIGKLPRQEDFGGPTCEKEVSTEESQLSM